MLLGQLFDRGVTKQDIEDTLRQVPMVRGTRVAINPGAHYDPEKTLVTGINVLTLS